MECLQKIVKDNVSSEISLLVICQLAPPGTECWWKKGATTKNRALGTEYMTYQWHAIH